MDKTPKLNTSKLTEEQRVQLEKWKQNKKVITALEDLGTMTHEVIELMGKKTYKEDWQSVGAVLMDMRDSLKELNDKEQPETPDQSKPVVQAVDKLGKTINDAIKKIDFQPDINVSSPDVNIEAPNVDLQNLEKLLKDELPKLTKQIVGAYPKIEMPKYPDRWDEVLEWLQSIDTASRMKPEFPVSQLNTISSTATTTGTAPIPTTSTLNTNSVIFSQQPDGDFVVQRADGSIYMTATNLAANATVTSDWYDIDGFGTIEFFVKSDVPSAIKGLEIEWTDNANAATPTVQSTDFREFKAQDVRLGSKIFHLRPKLDGVRISYTNGPLAQSDVFIEMVGRVFPEPGIENTAGAVVSAEFNREVSLGNVSNYQQNTKFGRNPEVDTAQNADIWGGGRNTLGIHDYTGFNATANENLATVSTSTEDAGTLLSSGTITTAALNNIIDSNATFITDGVAVGDIILNDTRGTYGYVKEVVSETELATFTMIDSATGRYDNIVGGDYRVATTNGTGAAVVVWTRIINADLERQTNVFVIMNGTTTVTTTSSAYRCSRGKVLLAGSTGYNVGEIRLNQATTTANVFCVMPATVNQTLIACDTVPKDTIFLIESVLTQMSISGGAQATAVVSLRARPRGGVFNTIRVYDLSSGGGSVFDTETGGIALQQGTDFKLRVDEVSANNTRVSARLEYLEINEI